MQVLESRIQAKTVAYAKKLGYLVLRLNYGGWPDRLFVTPNGGHVYVEFKRPGSYASPLQRVRHEELRRRGCEVHLVSTYEQGVEVLNAHLET